MSVGQRQRLVAELLEQPAGFGQLLAVETLNGKDREFVNEVQKLDGSIPVVSAQKLTVSLGDHQFDR